MGWGGLLPWGESERRSGARGSGLAVSGLRWPWGWSEGERAAYPLRPDENRPNLAPSAGIAARNSPRLRTSAAAMAAR